MKKYYFVRNNEKIGPLSLNELVAENIERQTLIWYEGLEEWVQASAIDELNDFFKASPPPIPTEIKETIFKVEAQINDKKDKLIKPDAKIATAKEIKFNAKLILYAFIIGLISFPIFFNAEDGFKHLSMKSKWKNASWEEYSELSRESRRMGFIKENTNYDAKFYHKWNLDDAIENAFLYSICTFGFAMLFLILGRYIAKGVKWVENNSKE